MKRSRAPIFWLLFGAGGMLSALTGPALVLVTGIAAPLGWRSAPGLMGYAQMKGLLSGPIAGTLAFVVVALFAWHAAHRIFKTLHDLGLGHGAGAKAACYGSAMALTAISAAALFALGR